MTTQLRELLEKTRDLLDKFSTEEKTSGQLVQDLDAHQCVAEIDEILARGTVELLL